MPERLRRLAEVIVGYCGAVEQGDLVVLHGSMNTEPLIEQLYAATLRAGGRPATRVLPELSELLLTEGSEEQVAWLAPGEREDVEQADVWIVVEAPANTKALTGVDPERQALNQRARSPLRERYLERARRGELRWVLTGFPTNAAAQDAEMSLAEYEDFLYGAALLDAGDPVARWRELSADLRRIVEFLSAREELRFVAEGTDLTFAVGGRTWIPADGHENFPDGEVFTAPLEESAEGEITFTFPAVFEGRRVEDVRLRFRAGEVVEATAMRGEAFLQEMLAVDDGARRVGELAFGLNDAVRVFTRNILFDEKIGGTMHLALGSAYPECGGTNRSALHWDLICDLRSGGEVYADGELVYRDGRFLAL
ncbi:MAG TPA: aminopeptidase [Gaiellaceae bacterium]|nr:aminopeptidase [Gaiellaceae bacterium]